MSAFDYVALFTLLALFIPVFAAIFVEKPSLSLYAAMEFCAGILGAWFIFTPVFALTFWFSRSFAISVFLGLIAAAFAGRLIRESDADQSAEQDRTSRDRRK